MPSVAVNPPKTPVTKGSNGIASATLPNICKMPPPPPPFCPTPLPNIGMSGKNPQKYTSSVKVEGQPVAIQGASFDSVGDIASKATGGGVVSSNAEGPTTFIGLGALDTKFEGKDVQFLGDQMLNNCGPPGSPANSATMGGVLQAPLIAQGSALDVLAELQEICDALCECTAKGEGQNCISKKLKENDAKKAGKGTIKAEAPYNMDTKPPSPMPYPGHRRPDAVIVKNPALPPVQSNLKAVLDVKLPGDSFRNNHRGNQKTDFERIAGDRRKLVVMTKGPDGCECPDEKDKPHPVPVPIAKEVDEKNRQLEFEFPQALKPVAVATLAVAAVAAAVALAAPAAVVGGLAVAGAAVFALFAGGPVSAGGGDSA